MKWVNSNRGDKEWVLTRISIITSKARREVHAKITKETDRKNFKLKKAGPTFIISNRYFRPISTTIMSSQWRDLSAECKMWESKSMIKLKPKKKQSAQEIFGRIRSQFPVNLSLTKEQINLKNKSESSVLVQVTYLQDQTLQEEASWLLWHRVSLTWLTWLTNLQWRLPRIKMSRLLTVNWKETQHLDPLKRQSKQETIQLSAINSRDQTLVQVVAQLKAQLMDVM